MRSFLFSILLISTSFAQDVFRIGIGFNSVSPSGDFSNYSNHSIGYSFRTEYEIDEFLTSTVILSINNFSSKLPLASNSEIRKTREINSSELMLGLQYSLSKKFFLLFHGGMNYISLPKEYYTDFDEIIENNSKTEAYYILSPGLGYREYLSENINLLLTTRYSLVNGQFTNFNRFEIECIFLIDIDL